MHPRTQYLSDSHDPAQQPLLQDSSRISPDRPVLQSAAEPPVRYGKGSTDDTPSAPHFSQAGIEASPSATQPSTGDYGLPSAYQAQYAG